MCRYVILILIASSLIGLVACDGQSPPIAPERMASILYDYHKIDAMLEEDRRKTYYQDSAVDLRFASLFDKYDITQDEFDSARIWYGMNLDEYVQIYGDLLEKISNERSQGEAYVQSFRGRDSIDIWEQERQITFTPTFIDAFRSFEIKCDDVSYSAKAYCLDFHLFGTNDNLISPFRVRLSLEYNDTTTSVTQSPTDDGAYRMVINTIAGRSPIRVKGMFYLNPYDINYFRIYIDRIKLITLKEPPALDVAEVEPDTTDVAP